VTSSRGLFTMYTVIRSRYDNTVYSVHFDIFAVISIFLMSRFPYLVFSVDIIFDLTYAVY